MIGDELWQGPRRHPVIIDILGSEADQNAS
jgi:hypothetical protein